MEIETSVFSNTILHLLHVNDRFCKNFERWSIDRKSDRIVISIILSMHAQIENNLIYTLHMLYPGRLQGPFLNDKTMTIEILNISVKTDFVVPARLQETLIERPVKRIKNETDDSQNVFIDIEAITSQLAAALTKTNSSLCTLGSRHTGRDEAGVWISYDIICNQRLNLSFFTSFILGDDCLPIRDMRLRISPQKQVFLRVYEKNERRVVGAWEVVPVYENQGVFVCMRHKIASK